MSRVVVQASWSDVPHLSEAQKAEYLAAIPPYMREARAKGVPHIGRGAIFPIPDSEIEIPDFKIPDMWPRCFGGDVSKTWTAFVWLAWHKDSDTVYLYSCFKTERDELASNAVAVRSRGAWIPGVADAADIRSDEDRRQYVQIYRDDHAIDMELPDKAVETGNQQVWDRLQGGRLKVFSSCQAWFEEKRHYRVGADGKIVKKNDHLMDASRYGIRSGLARAMIKPNLQAKLDPTPKPSSSGRGAKFGWMG